MRIDHAVHEHERAAAHGFGKPCVALPMRGVCGHHHLATGEPGGILAVRTASSRRTILTGNANAHGPTHQPAAGLLLQCVGDIGTGDRQSPPTISVVAHVLRTTQPVFPSGNGREPRRPDGTVQSSVEGRVFASHRGALVHNETYIRTLHPVTIYQANPRLNSRP